MKSVRCIVILLLYVALFVFYIYELPLHYFAETTLKFIFYSSTLLMLLFCFEESKSKFESWWHKQLHGICNYIMMINFGIMALHYGGIIEKSFYLLTVFGISVFIVTLLLLISGSRHHEFDN